MYEDLLDFLADFFKEEDNNNNKKKKTDWSISIDNALTK